MQEFEIWRVEWSWLDLSIQYISFCCFICIGVVVVDPTRYMALQQKTVKSCCLRVTFERMVAGVCWFLVATISVHNVISVSNLVSLGVRSKVIFLSRRVCVRALDRYRTRIITCLHAPIIGSTYSHSSRKCQRAKSLLEGHGGSTLTSFYIKLHREELVEMGFKIKISGRVGRRVY